MFDFVIDFIVEMIGDLFDGASDVVAEQGVPEVAEPPVGDGGWLASADGGISPDRFDPKPPMGPYSP